MCCGVACGENNRLGLGGEILRERLQSKMKSSLKDLVVYLTLDIYINYLKF